MEPPQRFPAAQDNQDAWSGKEHAKGDKSHVGRDGQKTRGPRRNQGKRKDLGRSEWSRNPVNRRSRHERDWETTKRRKLDGKEAELPVYATQFSKEELEAESKKPKRKVAVMIGYSGSGYKGMQLSHREKTIEGDLFRAFVEAGAISKANADDPKKVSLVRCARTDKGVHAAGNLISLKLIIEDANVVEKINEHLSPQIRVFGIERTNGSFSAYQFCDSRIYEYLIPTHCFLPPHPDSYLGRNLDQLAEEADDVEAYRERQSEVSSYWADVEERIIKPVVDQLDASVQPIVRKALYEISLKEAEEAINKATIDPKVPEKIESLKTQANSSERLDHLDKEDGDNLDIQSQGAPPKTTDKAIDPKPEANEATPSSELQQDNNHLEPGPEVARSEANIKEPSPLELAIRQLKAAYITARKTYRITPKRLERIRTTLSHFIGTHNFHNYTIEKTPHDPSAKRVIKTFTISSSPLLINDTEWLSLKIHGQSFMMHQIRKMVSMATLLVRCGARPETKIQESYAPPKVGIPKAPGLGLLLERPVFDAYNEKIGKQFERPPIEFEKFATEMEAFKQREIYARIFREEENHGHFHNFFTALDNNKSSSLLYLSSMGSAAVVSKAKTEILDDDNDDAPSDEEDAEDGAGGSG